MSIALASLGIWAADLLPIDEDIARRVLVRAREIAPGIRTVVPGSEEQRDALAILRGVAARAAGLGAGTVASKGRNGTSISFRDIKSAFFDDDITSLRAIFAMPGEKPAGMPVGSFPDDRPLRNLWPEGDYR